MPKKDKKESSDEVVISLDQFAIPGAIILAGVIIAVTIFFTNKNKTNEVDEGSSETVAGEETDSTETDSEFDNASVEIDESPVLGDISGAKVAVVEFSEYRCGYCNRHMEETLPLLVENYINTGDIVYVFKDFAMYGNDAANAAKCVYHLTDVDTYKEFHSKIFNYEDDDDIYSVAKEVGVNESDFDSCYSSREYQDEVDADYQVGQDVGIQGTPGFVIGTIENGVVNGVLVPGAYPYETFQTVIDGFLSE